MVWCVAHPGVALTHSGAHRLRGETSGGISGISMHRFRIRARFVRRIPRRAVPSAWCAADRHGRRGAGVVRHPQSTPPGPARRPRGCCGSAGSDATPAAVPSRRRGCCAGDGGSELLQARVSSCGHASARTGCPGLTCACPGCSRSDPLNAFESRWQGGRGATPSSEPQVRQYGDDGELVPDYGQHLLDGGADGLPTSFASSRGARGRGGGGAPQQRPAKVPRQEVPRPQGHAPLGGRGGPRDGRHERRGNERGNERRGGGMDAFISRSMVEDPWAPLVQRQQQLQQQQWVPRGAHG